MIEVVRPSEQAVPSRPAQIPVRVAKKWAEAEDVVALELTSADGSSLPSFDAGAFIDVELPDGMTRPYSLANAPRDADRYLLAVLLERRGRGGSLAIHNSVQQGDVLRVSPPRNAFPLRAGAVHTVLMAGGIGVTPLVSMAGHLWHTGAPFDLHYCVRTRERAAFLRWLQKAPYRSRVHLWFSSAGASGRLDMAKSIARVPRLSQLYVCGPATFMDAAQSAALQAGLDPARVHRESFEDTHVCPQT